jgi:hypothetical protein
VLVLALDAGCFGPGSHGTALVASAGKGCQRDRRRDPNRADGSTARVGRARLLSLADLLYDSQN